MADDAAEASKSSDPMGALMERRKYKGQSFASAFREARNSGDKTFFWNGKKYTTDLAPAKPVPPAGEPGGAYRSRREPSDMDMGREGSRVSRTQQLSDTNAGRGGRGGPTAEELRMQRLSDTFAGRSVGRGGVTPGETSETEYKRGGQAKAYASGGSVKGAGIAQRGVRKCKMV